MKIVCDSCSAKYSIADEKVAGRVFKIRCKKCGAAIVVRGDQVNVGGAEAEDASTRVVDYGGDAVWHVVVDGDQQGPFAPAQLGEMLSAGTIGWDAFVWKEGFDDWKPAQDVEELVQAIMGGSDQAQSSGDASQADPFAAAQQASGAESSGFGGPAAVASRSEDAGADLFAQADSSSPFDGGSDEEDDVVASAPSPRVSAEQALTGARNENSVLFSLSNLQALATGSSSSSSSSSSSASTAKPGMAQGEGSGLIDIRALASATGLTPGSSGPVTSASDDKVDDLLSIGSVGGGLGSPLGAPVIIPEKKEEKSKGPIYAGIAAVVVLGLGISAMAFFSRGGDEAPVAAAGTVAPGQAVTAVGAPQPTEAAQPVEAAQPAAAAQPAPAAPEPTAQAPAAAAAAEEEASGEQREARADSASRRDRPRAGRRGGGGGGAASSASAKSASSSGSGGSSRRSSGSSDIDDLLNEAIGGGGGRQAAKKRGGGGGGGGGGGASSGPQTPSRSDIMTAMNGVQGAVRACGQGNRGTAVVRVSFAGNTGRATSAQVNSSLPGPVKSCIAAAVRRARVPPFQQASFSVNYPFTL